MEHTPGPGPCDCLEGRALHLTIGQNAAQRAVALAVTSDREFAPPPSYLEPLRAAEGRRVDVLHVFRAPSGLPTGYTVALPCGALLHLRPLLAVEAEPVEGGAA